MAYPSPIQEPIEETPWSEGDSMHDGYIDRDFISVLQHHRKSLNAILQVIIHDKEDFELAAVAGAKRVVRKRKKRGIIWYRDDDGKFSLLPPTKSLWYSLYCWGEEVGLQIQPKFHKKFRNRFRMPYFHYQELVAMCRHNASSGGCMHRWKEGRPSNRGTTASPFELLVLGAL